jgi:hypothetical protein
VELLSDEIISRTRAWSIIHNPYATDDLYVVSALFVNDEIAAYTHLFPDEQDGQRIYWNTTLYCAPKYEGRGYAAIVIGQFCELYGEHYFDLNAAAASVANLKFCGLNVEYVPQYILSGKAISGKGLKALGAKLLEKITYICTNQKKRLLQEIANATFTLKYTTYLDDKVYEFVREHSTNNVFLRPKEIFNWILTYPLMQESPLIKRVVKDSEFTSTRAAFRMFGVEVYDNKQLIGFYILNVSEKIVDVSYVYYDTEQERRIFLSIAEHILKFNKPRVITTDERLLMFIQSYKIFTRMSQYNKSFSYPKWFVHDASKTMQSGDGDNIT